MNWPMGLAYYWPGPKNKGLGYSFNLMPIKIPYTLVFWHGPIISKLHGLIQNWPKDKLRINPL